MANGFIIGVDSVTIGRWIGKFGGGHWIAKTNSGVTPSWITSWVKPAGSTATFTLPNTDNYMQVPGSTDSNTVYSITSFSNIDLTMADNGSYVTSVYILSSTSSRRLSIKLQDITGTTTYSTYTDPVTWSSQGKWYRVFHWGGNCRIRVESVSGTIPMCGIVFDKFDNQFGDTSEGV